MRPTDAVSRLPLGFVHCPRTGKKTPGGAGTHTGHTSAHADTRRTQTNLTSIQTQRHTRTTTRRSRNPKPRPTQQPQEQPQARSRPLPAADSEEAAPSEPDPASTRSQSASPRLLEGGRQNEGARGRCHGDVYCVTAGGAARAPDELETREAETGMRNGRGEADLRPVKRHRGEGLHGTHGHKDTRIKLQTNLTTTPTHNCSRTRPLDEPGADGREPAEPNELRTPKAWRRHTEPRGTPV